MEALWQVCSLVVQIKTQMIADITGALSALPGCEIALSDAGKGVLIVVVEAAESDALLNSIESVRNVAGVLAVSLVYHQQDEQGEEAP